MMRARITAWSVAVFVVLLAARSQAEVLIFLDDFEGFLAAAGAGVNARTPVPASVNV